MAKKRKKRKKRKECPSCGDRVRECKKCNSHHSQPRSRFGQDGDHNRVIRHKKKEHEPFHILFGNDRVGEAARKVLFDWSVVNPYLESREVNSTTPQGPSDDGWPRFDAWDDLFGRYATRTESARVLIEKFTVLEKDKDHLRRVIVEAAMCGHIVHLEHDQLIHAVDSV